VQHHDLVGSRLDYGTPDLRRRDAIADVPQMNCFGADSLDVDPTSRRVQGSRIQCGEALPVYTDRVEYALHSESAFCAREQRPAPTLDTPVRCNSSIGKITYLLVLQVCRDRSDDGLGRATGVDLIAFAGGTCADRRGLVIMTDHCQDRTLQTWMGIRTRDVPDRRASLHQWRHETRRSTGPGKALRPPVTAGQVEPASAAGERKLGYLITPEAAHDPFGDVESTNRISR
jgi:hypothetical protein